VAGKVASEADAIAIAALRLTRVGEAEVFCEGGEYDRLADMVVRLRALVDELRTVADAIHSDGLQVEIPTPPKSDEAPLNAAEVRALLSGL